MHFIDTLEYTVNSEKSESIYVYMVNKKICRRYIVKKTVSFFNCVLDAILAYKMLNLCQYISLKYLFFIIYGNR